MKVSIKPLTITIKTTPTVNFKTRQSRYSLRHPDRDNKRQALAGSSRGGKQGGGLAAPNQRPPHRRCNDIIATWKATPPSCALAVKANRAIWLSELRHASCLFCFPIPPLCGFDKKVSFNGIVQMGICFNLNELLQDTSCPPHLASALTSLVRLSPSRFPRLANTGPDRARDKMHHQHTIKFTAYST